MINNSHFKLQIQLICHNQSKRQYLIVSTQYIMQSIKNFFSTFNSLIKQSRALKVLFYSFMGCFIISILLLFVIAPLFDCNVFASSKACVQSLPFNSNECSAFNNDYCCGTQGKEICLNFFNCQIKPTFFNTPLCANFLALVWLFEVIGIVLSVPFFILLLKIQKKHQPISNTYINLNKIAIIGKETDSNSNVQIEYYQHAPMMATADSVFKQ